MLAPSSTHYKDQQNNNNKKGIIVCMNNLFSSRIMLYFDGDFSYSIVHYCEWRTLFRRMRTYKVALHIPFFYNLKSLVSCVCRAKGLFRCLKSLELVETNTQVSGKVEYICKSWGASPFLLFREEKNIKLMA